MTSEPPPRNGDTSHATSVNLHATAISIAGRAALIRGPSGSGKSDLALRCMALAPGPLLEASPMLVADDRVVVTRTSDHLIVTCPGPLKGLIEVRGLGVLPVPSVSEALLRLLVDLVPPSDVERMPLVGDTEQVCGLPVPRIALAPFEASAPLKLILALRAFAGH